MLPYQAIVTGRAIAILFLHISTQVSLISELPSQVAQMRGQFLGHFHKVCFNQKLVPCVCFYQQLFENI